MNHFLFYSSITFVFSLFFVYVVRFFAHKFHIVDTPGAARKIHKTPIPLAGGVAVISAFSVGVLIAWPSLIGGFIEPEHLIGVLIASWIIAIGGIIDDKYNLPPHFQFIAPISAIFMILFFGIGIEYVTNPFGGTIDFSHWRFPLWEKEDGTTVWFSFVADILTILWLLGMMYTTKFLDGLDGLVSGVTVIGAGILFFVSLLPQLQQPQTALLALLVAAAFAGFLVFNWHPASIFLGESGSLFAGFMLGVISIIAGTKIVTSILILGIPILDVFWVIIRRLFFEHRSPFQADRKHLHLRLIDSGYSQRRSVLILYGFTFLFGISSLFLQTKQKFIALAVMIVVMYFFALYIVRQYKNRS